MDIYSQAVAEIIKQQQSVIGPLALDQARKVLGLTITDESHFVISGNGKEVLTHLVEQYSTIFGRASIEVCKEAVRHLKDQPKRDELPEILR